MNKLLLLPVALCLFTSNFALADTFGTGANQFSIDFVSISGDASSANGTYTSEHFASSYGVTYIDPGYDYRMGVYEITNDQWSKFQSNLGMTLNGSPTIAYDQSAIWIGANQPANGVSWYEAIQFVNWLNTSNGYHAAYNFTGIQGTSNYTFNMWEQGDAGYNTSNPYRNSNAKYFLPSEAEWVKAAYWNGTVLQTYATVDGSMPIEGVDTNYNLAYGNLPWNVGSGTEELNGTFDMMGNVWEWLETPYRGSYTTTAIDPVIAGSSYYQTQEFLFMIGFPARNYEWAYGEWGNLGFRVASVIPEPATLSLLALGSLTLLRKRK